MPSEFTHDFVVLETQPEKAKAAKEAIEGSLEGPGGKRRAAKVAEMAKAESMHTD